MPHIYLQGSDGKFFTPGTQKRNYVDADGTQYTVWVKWVDGKYLCRPHKRVGGKFRVVPQTHWHETEQEAQEELDWYAYEVGLKEEENGD